MVSLHTNRNETSAWGGGAGDHFSFLVLLRLPSMLKARQLPCLQPRQGEKRTLSPDVVLTESVEVFSLGITLQIIKQLAQEDGGTHAAVCRHRELTSSILQGAAHLQNLLQTWKDTPLRQ